MQPLASLKALADPIYEVFYGLTDQPFGITTDPKFFYQSKSHERAFAELASGLKRREGILLLTGETGTGKTTLCRAVLESLGPRTFSALILNPYMSGPDIFRVILRDFGLASREELRRGVLATADVTQLLETLEGFVRSLVPFDGHAVIVLDEAQSLSPQTLDQIRILTALEQDNKRLIQIVLCGQPSLLDTLKTEPMYALNERITRRVTLAQLPPDEVDAYIQHRIKIAGGESAVSFDTAAAKLVSELAHGLPRRINVLCDRALQEGRIEGVNVITPPLVKRAARSLAGAHEKPEPVHPAEPVTRIPAEDSNLLTFGQKPPKRGLGKRIALLFAGGVLTALALGYGYYFHRLANQGPAIQVTPSAPQRDLGQPAVPLEVPPPEQPSPESTAPAPPSTTPAFGTG